MRRAGAGGETAQGNLLAVAKAQIAGVEVGFVVTLDGVDARGKLQSLVKRVDSEIREELRSEHGERSPDVAE